MLLEDKYYRILAMQTEGMEATFRIALLPDCDVYRGHFPGNPVSPGACNIEMIQECAMRMAGKKLRFSSIKQCRLTAITSPGTCPEVEVKISLTPSDDSTTYALTAQLLDHERTYLECKGSLTA